MNENTQNTNMQNAPADPAVASLAQQDAAAAAGATKLAEMLKAKGGAAIPPGRTYASPGAAKVANEAEKPSAEVQARETRRAELNRYDNPDGVHSKDPVKQKKAMAEMRSLLAAGQTQEERDNFVNQSIGDLRDAIGVAEEFRPPTRPSPQRVGRRQRGGGHRLLPRERHRAACRSRDLLLVRRPRARQRRPVW